MKKTFKNLATLAYCLSCILTIFYTLELKVMNSLL